MPLFYFTRVIPKLNWKIKFLIPQCLALTYYGFQALVDTEATGGVEMGMHGEKDGHPCGYVFKTQTTLYYYYYWTILKQEQDLEKKAHIIKTPG